MPLPRKIVVHSVRGYSPDFDALVAVWIKEGVNFVGVVGVEAEKLEDVVDDISVGDGTNSYFMLTTAHPRESLAEAVAFAESLSGEHAGPVRIVEF